MENFIRYFDFLCDLAVASRQQTGAAWREIVKDVTYDMLQKLKEYAKDNKIPGQDKSWRNIDILWRKCCLFGDSPAIYKANFIDEIREIFSDISEWLSRNDNVPIPCGLIEYCHPKRLHQLICERIFEEASFWVRIDHDDSAADALAAETRGSEGAYVRLAMISESAMAYDSAVFAVLNGAAGEQSRQTAREIFRPYFMEYYLDISKMDERQRKLLRTMRETVEGGEEEYGWYQARFASDDEAEEENAVIFQGVYAYSASPVTYQVRKLVIVDGTLDIGVCKKINDTYQLPQGYCRSDGDIQKKLTAIFAGVTFHTARVYKVGNGNCIYSYGTSVNQTKGLLYDVGFDNHTSIKKIVSQMPSDHPYQPALKRIHSIVPDCVIISHWDADHYMACAGCEKELFECTWIAPDYKDASSNAKRLANYLYFIGNMMFVDRSKSGEINVPLGGSELKLYVGGSHDGGLSKANCEGIAIEYVNDLSRNGRGGGKEIRCLMQGDVPYCCLPVQAQFCAKNPYTYLVAPHHGSRMDISLLSCGNGRAGDAIICCNDNKGKNRPEQAHLQALQRCYNNVALTQKAYSHIDFDLTKENGMVIR